MSMNELESKIHELRELRRMAEELQAEMESITDSIKAHMDSQGVDTLTGMDWKATYKTVTSSRVDTSALKKELPEIAQRFSKVTVTRRFCVA
jgi:predicted phage-related endonuclease